MSFHNFESGAAIGAPVELVVFEKGSNVYRYTTHYEDVRINNTVYESVNIRRSKVERGEDLQRNGITLTAPRTLSFTNQYLIVPPSEIVKVVAMTFHINDPTRATRVAWRGRVVNVAFDGDNVNIKCETILTSLRRNIPRRLFQYNCPHVLYGSSCRAVRSTFTTVATIVSDTPLTLTVSGIDGFDDGYFTGGWVDYVNGNETSRAFIADHTGSVLTLTNRLLNVVSGNSVSVYAGCDRTIETCNQKFNNLLNFGGFPFIPEKNPFDGTPVF